ncbi:type ISP restriction/modification enzyme [Streptomyces sp. NPDC005576]|uniref:type ISP restriction/modification enzyme n=1 Tax=Streptomyces sp. NPDC005576 TaxID=3364726 RepID=UPI00369F3B5E
MAAGRAAEDARGTAGPATGDGGGVGAGPGSGTTGRVPRQDAGHLTLDELMPWSVRPLRTGRSWVTGPDPVSLKARWERLVRAGGEEQKQLFRPSRFRTPHAPAAALPGRTTSTGRFARDPGAYPEPVRVQHGPFDEQWLIPDQRLIDAARPELWRVADAHQLFTVEHGCLPGDSGPALSVTALLPDGYLPAGRPGRVRPLYRRPGGAEPNLTPGLCAALGAAGLGGTDGPGTDGGEAVNPESLLAWTLVAARPSPAGCLVPLPRDGALWSAGVELGRELLRLHLRGARGGERPRLPGGRRPYVRSAVPPRPGSVAYDAGSGTLLLDEGRIAPVPAGAWEYRVGGVRMLETWFDRRAAAWAGPERDGLDAMGPAGWPREWTSELLELITVLALLDGLRDRLREIAGRIGTARTLGREELRAIGVLPVPAAARRPASVLGGQEEGPEGQFTLL